MKEETTSLGARAQSAIQGAAVLYKSRLATFNLLIPPKFMKVIPRECCGYRGGKMVVTSQFSRLFQFLQ
jgi:hypothetical protein